MKKLNIDEIEAAFYKLVFLNYVNKDAYPIEMDVAGMSKPLIKNFQPRIVVCSDNEKCGAKNYAKLFIILDIATRIR